MKKTEFFLVATATALVIIILSTFMINVDKMTNDYAKKLAYEKEQERQLKKLSQER